ncbi:HAD hydrolase-like protein [Streptomyces sp. ISL-43]|uniref:HAD family hydrolase n=1 Tax=Streptomyces sp. ISL-43 TaxID=2819183 RepID=UPI001BEC5086|nr:HAD family hydrolase [Streptomyces sp. ISL-43]MBT2450855.1 HAD hydrolase-like protein [Streptomyces sp. ISL-43]
MDTRGPTLRVAVGVTAALGNKRDPARSALGLRGVVFDVDGVLTDSVGIHAAAWKAALDPCLEAMPAARLAAWQRHPFDEFKDYLSLVDGKPGFDGALAFLSSRGLRLPEGRPGDGPGCATVWALAAAKEAAFLATVSERRVEAFPDVEPALSALHAWGVACAAVSVCRDASDMLTASAIRGLFDTVVDGTEADRLSLAGTPDPALFLEGARRLHVPPAQAVVAEDSPAGAEAGMRGGFALVAGINRSSSHELAARLYTHGADVVVRDLAGMLRAAVGRWEGP